MFEGRAGVLYWQEQKGSSDGNRVNMETAEQAPQPSPQKEVAMWERAAASGLGAGVRALGRVGLTGSAGRVQWGPVLERVLYASRLCAP